MSMHRHVHFFTPYGRKAGSSRVRVFDWLDHTQIEATVHSFTQGNRAGLAQLRDDLKGALQRHRELARTRVDNTDIVFIQRELTPFTDGSQEARLLRSASRGIVDLDDGLQWDWGSGGWARSLRPKAPKVLKMVRAADVVIAGNDLIAEWAAPHAARVVVIPSCVEPDDYVRKTNYELKSPPTLGWIGSSSTEQYLSYFADAFLTAHASSGAVIELVGDATQHLPELEHMVRRLQWSEEVATHSPQHWDIGVMPLRDGLFERAKCAYKILQYGAAGVPTLASHVGVNAEVVNTPPLDAESLRVLLSATPDDRRALGDELHGIVRSRFAFSVWRDAWLEAVFGTARV